MVTYLITILPLTQLKDTGFIMFCKFGTAAALRERLRISGTVAGIVAGPDRDKYSSIRLILCPNQPKPDHEYRQFGLRGGIDLRREGRLDRRPAVYGADGLELPAGPRTRTTRKRCPDTFQRAAGGHIPPLRAHTQLDGLLVGQAHAGRIPHPDRRSRDNDAFRRRCVRVALAGGRKHLPDRGYPSSDAARHDRIRRTMRCDPPHLCRSPAGRLARNALRPAQPPDAAAGRARGQGRIRPRGRRRRSGRHVRGYRGGKGG